MREELSGLQASLQADVGGLHSDLLALKQRIAAQLAESGELIGAMAASGDAEARRLAAGVAAAEGEAGAGARAAAAAAALQA